MTAHGKFVYLEIPTNDVERSANLYQRVFNWRTRERGDGALAFDDATGGVSAAWRTGRPAQDTAGIVVSVNVEDVATSIQTISDAGGQRVDGIGRDSGEVTAWFRDPDGNLLAPYQEPNA